MSGYTREIQSMREHERMADGNWVPAQDFLKALEEADRADADMRTRELRTCMNIGEMALVVPCQRPS